MGSRAFQYSNISLRNVFGGIVLRVAPHAHGFHFDHARAAPGAAFGNGFAGGLVYGDYVVAVHDRAGDAVGDGAIGEIFEGHLARDGRGIGPLIVFDDQDERRALRGGEIQAFVERAGGAAAVADPGHGDDVLAEIAPGHGYAGHHRDQIAEHGDGRDDVATFRSPKWLVPSLPCVGEVYFAMCCVKMSRGGTPFTSSAPMLRIMGAIQSRFSSA